MHSLTKRTIASVFIIVASIPFTLSVYFLVQQEMIHFNIHKAFEEQSLQTMRIIKADAEWINEGKELLINGKLFDVKYIREAGNYIEVTGLFDGKEDELNHQLKKTEREKSPVNSIGHNTLITFLFQTLFSNATDVNTNTLMLTRNYSFLNTENLYSIYTNLKSPPPKI